MSVKDELMRAIADHAQKTTGQAMSDYELESAADALKSFVMLLAETDQKVMKIERNKRNTDYPHQA